MISDSRLRAAFIDLADTLVRGYDAFEFLSRLTEYCIDALGVQAGGVLLAAPDGKVSVAAASSAPGMRALELFEMQSEEGPCADAYRSGRQIIVEDLPAAAQRWPRFAPRALEAGFRAVVACPLRLRDDVIGALNLLADRCGSFDETAVATAQALADVAAIGILHERAITDAQERARQLQNALSSRVVIEQAKGMLAERHDIPVTDAFEVLRAYARSNNWRLHEVAQALMDGRVDSAGLK